MDGRVLENAEEAHGENFGCCLRAGCHQRICFLCKVGYRVFVRCGKQIQEPFEDGRVVGFQKTPVVDQPLDLLSRTLYTHLVRVCIGWNSIRLYTFSISVFPAPSEEYNFITHSGAAANQVARNRTFLKR